MLILHRPESILSSRPQSPQYNATLINKLLGTLNLEAKNLTVGSNVAVGHLFALYLETKNFSAVESHIKKQLSLNKMKAFRHRSSFLDNVSAMRQQVHAIQRTF